MTAHLRECVACRERLQQTNAFFEALADVSHDESRASEVEARPLATTHASLASVSDGAAMHIGVDDDFGAEHDDEIKIAARLKEFFRRLHKQKQEAIHRQPAARMRRWLPVAALIPLLIFGATFSRMQTVVRAEELLGRATRHERSLSTDRVQRLRFRFTPGIPAFASPVSGGARPTLPRVAPFLVVRDVTGGIALDIWPAAAASGEYAPLDEALSRHGFEIREPHGLGGMQAWRASLLQKHDEVFDRGDLLVLRTTTSEGALREVELTVRRHDYHVIKLTLAVEGIGRLEIDELEESVRRAVKAAAPGSAAPAGAPAAAPALAARASSAAGSVSTPVAPVGRTVVAQRGLSRWLDRNFGALPDRNTFVPDLQRLMTEVRQQLGALDTLARRYPEEEVEQQWASADRTALRRRVDQAYGAISRDLNLLDARVGLLFGPADRVAPVADAPPDWRRRAARALMHAEALDRELRHLLTFADVPAADARAAGAPPVLSTFAALWDVVHTPAGGPVDEP